MKNFAVTIFIILIIVTLGLYLISFQVRETELCLVVTFGNPGRQITEPGWYFKWPFPIQQVVKYDSRMRVYAPETEETPTSGGEPIIVNSYVVWKISNPLDYYRATKKIRDPQEELLKSRIRNTQNNVIGLHKFSEFVNSDPDKIQFEKIENEMLQDLQKAVAAAQYGIEIKALGIKQLKVSEEVSKQVFQRMRSERERQASKIIADGNAKVVKIEERARSISEEITVAAQARAKEIMGEGDRAAAVFYRLLDADPELAKLLRALEALPVMLGKNATYVLSTEMDPFSLLQKIPALIPKDPNSLNDPNKPAGSDN
ncbi:MAG: protease modulator HflC [Sedimentisphaerales bacterium]|nr:protease modulator HflC [Sedimentisphaerales bacterium]